MPIKIDGLHHAGFLVSDINRSAAFYEGILGLRPLPRPDFGFPGRWYDLGEQQLHLMQSELIPGQTDQPNFDRHVAFSVSDIEATALELEQAGVAVARGSGRAGRPQLFIRDPDGNMIELR
jgi:glyoxylase I family protein